jgi:hypothetical protein
MRPKILVAHVAMMAMLAGCGRVGFAECDDAPCTYELDVVGPDGLVARYAMDDNPAKGTVTAVPRRYSAQCGAMCPAATDGVSGGGYYFNGSIRFLLPAKILPRDSAYTISVWLKLSIEPSKGMSPVTKIIPPENLNAVSLRLDPGMVEYEGSPLDQGNNIPTSCVAGVDIVNSQWHNVVMTWNQTDRIIFVDGNQENKSAAPLRDSDEAFGIGGDSDDGTPNLFYTGAIDDLRFYNRALSASEVTALFDTR